MDDDGESKATTDHEVIRNWIEDRGGIPAVVKGTEKHDEGAGVLRIDFVGDGQVQDETLEEISWEEFFDTFEEKQLAFLYQDTTKDGKESRFFKFIRRE